MRHLLLCTPALALISCAAKPEIVPFRGDFMPETIAILPITADDLPDVLRAALDAHAHLAVKRRGYEVVPVDVTKQMLTSLGVAKGLPPDPAALHRMRADFHVDTLLVRSGKPVKPYGDPLEAFVVQWLLVDTMTGVTFWSADQDGGTKRTTQYLLKGESPYAEDPLLSDEPMVQRTTGSWVMEVQPMSVAEVAELLQNALARRLPRYEPPPPER